MLLQDAGVSYAQGLTDETQTHHLAGGVYVYQLGVGSWQVKWNQCDEEV